MSLPNQVTVLRILLTPLFALVLVLEGVFYKYLSLLIFTLAVLSDWYDGYIARKSGKVTPTGKYLDPLADKLLITTAFGLFTFIGYVKLWMFVTMGLRDLVVTALRSYAISTGKPFHTNTLAKWKTFSQMLAIYAIFFWMILESSLGQSGALSGWLLHVQAWNLVDKLVLFVTLFTVATGVNYLYENRHHLKGLAMACYRVFVPTNVR